MLQLPAPGYEIPGNLGGGAWEEQGLGRRGNSVRHNAIEATLQNGYSPPPPGKLRSVAVLEDL